MPILELHYKLIEVSIRETSTTTEWVPVYTVTRTIQYFYDEEMTKIENEKVYVNTDVVYTKDWESMMKELYELPMN